MTTYCWSLDEENFHAFVKLNSPEEAAEEGFNDCPEAEVIYVGEQKCFRTSDFFSLDCMIERLQEQAYDKVGESSTDYLDDMSEDKKAEIEKLICDWFDTHYPVGNNFYGVENIEKFHRPVEKKED